MDSNMFQKQKISYDEDDPYQAYQNYQLVLFGLK